MEVLETETDRLQGQDYPTLPFAVLSYNRLVKLCEQPDPDDSLMMQRVRERGLRELTHRFVLEDVHKLATFLWPQFRHLKMLVGEERNRVSALNKNY